MTKLKLNLGCGDRLLEGYVNVDKFGSPDLHHDLEVTPWPWEDNSVEMIVMSHVLEHLGREPEVYEKLIKELYRVCCHDAQILIIVPHHRHELFYSDPTHVRPITVTGMRLLSQEWNRSTLARGSSDSPLGIYWGVDFEIVEARFRPSDLWRSRHPEQGENFDPALLAEEGRIYNNMIQEVTLLLKAVKNHPSKGDK